MSLVSVGDRGPMGGRVTARQSTLGGLAIDIDLPAAPAEGLPGEVA